MARVWRGHTHSHQSLQEPSLSCGAISHAVWLYLRLCLSFRDVEELLWERGMIVTDEDIRKWCRKFGQQ
jgi:hypothetical protein